MSLVPVSDPTDTVTHAVDNNEEKQPAIDKQKMRNAVQALRDAGHDHVVSLFGGKGADGLVALFDRRR